MIRVQREDFSPGTEIDRLYAGNFGIGGVAVFVGLVRDLNQGRVLRAMSLEHYPGMTERDLARIEDAARARWPLQDVLIIHRFGRLEPGDRIVLVAAAAAHRDDAFEACRFLIDLLKTEAPFWKHEETANGGRWVEARDTDAVAATRWSSSSPTAGNPGPSRPRHARDRG